MKGRDNVLCNESKTIQTVSDAIYSGEESDAEWMWIRWQLNWKQ